MRLKEDASSWKAQGLKAKLQPVPDEFKARSRKNTRRWCKGKVGREHDWDITAMKRHRYTYGHWGADGSSVEEVESLWIDWHCVNCGKQDYQIMRKDRASV